VRGFKRCQQLSLNRTIREADIGEHDDHATAGPNSDPLVSHLDV